MIIWFSVFIYQSQLFQDWRTQTNFFSIFSRLFELKGVVVLEKLHEYRESLKDPDVSPEEKIKILNELIEKQPSTQIISSSKIGKVIRRLRQDTSEGKFSFILVVSIGSYSVVVCYINLVLWSIVKKHLW